MPSIKSIKQRIRSVKNTAQITKAMEVVSATKMRRSQEFALKARPYAAASLELLQNLLSRTPEELMPPLLKTRPVQHSMLNIVTSDKGLAGAFNANVIKKAEAWIETKRATGASYSLVTVGKKAKEHFERRKIVPLKSFWKFGDYTTLEQTAPVAEIVLAGFLDRRWDEVWAAYANFRTTLLQEPVIKKILPATREGLEEAVRGILPERGRFATQGSSKFQVPSSSYNYEYKFEPSPAEILEELVPQLIRMQIHHIILESNASEHSARMVAMKNASDNAEELTHDLTLEFNKARQAGITQELAEITAGREALKG